jgi:hypothetical protein
MPSHDGWSVVEPLMLAKVVSVDLTWHTSRTQLSLIWLQVKQTTRPVASLGLIEANQ